MAACDFNTYLISDPNRYSFSMYQVTISLNERSFTFLSGVTKSGQLNRTFLNDSNSIVFSGSQTKNESRFRKAALES